MNKFRDHKALGKKIARALGKNEIKDAQRLERNLTPRMTLDHIIKERYPTFVDALRDLDDALSMLFLFANLPQTDTVPPKTIALCQRLCLEFQHYVIRTHSLRKSFLSIKGIYYQATIQGQDILWLVPYKFVQRVTGDVDFRIMGTFVEFYTTLLGFVNYRLYTGVGLVYPPKFDIESDSRGGELGAFRLEDKSTQNLTNGEPTKALDSVASAAAQAEADKLLAAASQEVAVPASSYETAPETVNQQEDEADAVASDKQLEEFPESFDPNADTLLQPSISVSAAAALFEPFTFFLSRETPRQPLEFLLRAFGCRKIGWDNVLGDGSYTTSESDSRITHQIVDRPDLPLPAAPEAEDDEEEAAPARPTRVPGRTYIQPQWVWDCVNAGRLLRTDVYAPGAVLPPHLSPFVKPRAGEYDPTRSLAEQEVPGEAEAAAEQAAEEEEVMDLSDAEPRTEQVAQAENIIADHDVEQGEGMAVELASDSESDGEAAVSEDDLASEEDSASEEDEELSAAARHQAELEAEASGIPLADPADDKPAKNAARKKIVREKKAMEEEQQRQKMMLSRRKRKLFEKMNYSNARKDEAAAKLRGKRRRIEGQKE